MKKTMIGIALLISAILIDICICISSSILSLGLTEWDTSYGKFWTALNENGFLFAFILGKMVFVFALIILIKEYFEKEKSELDF